MTEISKMYENAGIKGEWRDCRTKNGKIYEGKNPKNRNIRLCKPRFTAEKQIELIKWLSDTDYYIHNIYKTIDTKEYFIDNYYYDMQTDKFEKTLAGLINKLWQDLTDQEKEEIRGILDE